MVRWSVVAAALLGCSQEPAAPVVNVWVVPTQGGQGGASAGAGGISAAGAGGALLGGAGGQGGAPVTGGSGGYGGVGGSGGDPYWWGPDYQCEVAPADCSPLLALEPCVAECAGAAECVGLFCSPETGAPSSCAAAVPWTGTPWLCPHPVWCCGR